MKERDDASAFLERRLEAARAKNHRDALYWAIRAYVAAADARTLTDREQFGLATLIRSDAALLLDEDVERRCFFCSNTCPSSDLVGTSMRSSICKKCVLKYADDIRAGRW